MTNPPSASPTDSGFTYSWDFGEHVRLIRAVMRHRRGWGRWIFRALIVVMALVVGLALLGSNGHWGATIRILAPWVGLFALWIVLFHWGLPVYSAWIYQRTNPCVQHEMTRAVTPEGLQIRCHTTATDMRWDGVLRAVETPEFLLFYVSPSCAVQIPKRAIPNASDLTRVRSVVQQALGPKASLLAILLLLGGCARAAADPALDPGRFEAEIRAFEAADGASPSPPGGVVFIGSSSIKNWTDVAADFPDVAVLNRGFGGSTLADVVHYEDRILLPYRPHLVVLYAGDNDLVEGRTPGRVLGDYRAFIAHLRSELPAARVVYVSIKPSPSRRAYMDRAREANQRIRAETARDSLQTFVDVFTPMLDAAGQPRPELFLADSLHMTREGYLLWRSLLRPVVRSAR